jgi:ABC-type bacteriocin/lantibiotic exporter with double-glycine peptidase domain
LNSARDCFDACLLPIAYFQARRIGDSVARVRELENIRNFLTSSALTLVIDLFFTFVFLAIMFVYSPFLTFLVIGSFPFYIAISAIVTPIFRRRLDEKFERGTENQAFLVESVNLQQGCRFARYLHFPHDPPRVIHNADMVSATDTSNPAKWSMLRFSF